MELDKLSRRGRDRATRARRLPPEINNCRPDQNKSSAEQDAGRRAGSKEQIIGDLEHYEQARDVDAGCFSKLDGREIEESTVETEQRRSSGQQGKSAGDRVFMKTHPHDGVADAFADRSNQ